MSGSLDGGHIGVLKWPPEIAYFALSHPYILDPDGYISIYRGTESNGLQEE